MNHLKQLVFIIFSVFLFACRSDESEPFVPGDFLEDTYFPQIDNSNWESTSLEELNWSLTAKNRLDSFHVANNSRAFIVLHKGKRVIEEYWGRNILNNADFEQTSKWYWASAGKTLTSFLVGKAQEMGHLSIDEPSNKYLGQGWTTLSTPKEDLIQIRDQLSMTTGLDYKVNSTDCTLDTCLNYKVDAGQQWFYHNGPYTLLESVIANATNSNYDQFSDEQLELKIGMEGNWVKSGYNNVYWSTARDAARFGLLIYSNGEWSGTKIMEDATYFNAMLNSSQNINPSYGYLWWLNGKSSIIYPSVSTSFNTSLAPKAPADLIAAMGKNGQFIGIVPSLDIVVVRMGETPDNSLVPIAFHNDMWELILAMLTP